MDLRVVPRDDGGDHAYHGFVNYHKVEREVSTDTLNHSQRASGENTDRTTFTKPVVRSGQRKQQGHEDSKNNTDNLENDEEN